MFFAILNGGVREKVLFLHVSKKSAYLLSGFSLCFLILFCTYLFFSWLAINSWEASFFVGFIWVTTTIVFEFVFRYFIQKKELSDLLEAYIVSKTEISGLYSASYDFLCTLLYTAVFLLISWY